MLCRLLAPVRLSAHKEPTLARPQPARHPLLPHKPQHGLQMCSRRLRSISLIQLWTTTVLSPGHKRLGPRKARLTEASKGSQEQDCKGSLGGQGEQEVWAKRGKMGQLWAKALAAAGSSLRLISPNLPLPYSSCLKSQGLDLPQEGAMLFLIFLANALLPQQTHTVLHKRPQGYLQQAKASEHAGGVFCNIAYTHAGSWGFRKGAAAKK